MRDLVIDEQVSLRYCNTNEQPTHILTKAISKDKHDYFGHLLGICDFESKESAGI